MLVMEDLSEVIDGLMDRSPEFPQELATLASRQAKYKATGNILAASILLALAAETGLKLLYEIERPGALAPQGHDLIRLFDNLSTDSQEHLNRIYMQRIDASGILSRTGTDLSEPELAHVRGVFIRHARMFELWRYLPEGKAGPGYSEHLCRALDAIRILAGAMAERPSHEGVR